MVRFRTLFKILEQKRVSETSGNINLYSIWNAGVAYCIQDNKYVVLCLVCAPDLKPGVSYKRNCKFFNKKMQLLTIFTLNNVTYSFKLIQFCINFLSACRN